MRKEKVGRWLPGRRLFRCRSIVGRLCSEWVLGFSSWALVGSNVVKSVRMSIAPANSELPLFLTGSGSRMLVSRTAIWYWHACLTIGRGLLVTVAAPRRLACRGQREKGGRLGTLSRVSKPAIVRLCCCCRCRGCCCRFNRSRFWKGHDVARS